MYSPFPEIQTKKKKENGRRKGKRKEEKRKRRKEKGQTLVPGMSLYEFSQVSDAESQAVGDEEPIIFDS